MNMTGVMGTTTDGEREIIVPTLSITSTTNPPGPLGIVGTTALCPLISTSPGILLRAWGIVSQADNNNPMQWFEISDGSGNPVRCILPSGLSFKPNWKFLAVTGVSSYQETDDGWSGLVLLIRDSSDISVYQ